MLPPNMVEAFWQGDTTRCVCSPQDQLSSDLECKGGMMLPEAGPVTLLWRALQLVVGLPS